MTATCALCQNESVLEESHFFPRALYKIARGPEYKNPNPFLLTEGGMHQSCHQAKQHLLCGRCEDRLNDEGEDHVLRFCYRREGRFKLHSLLAGAHPLDEGKDGLRYSANDLIGVDPDKFTHFGAGILWKASITSWTIDNVTYGKPPLGPYREQFRRYLLGIDDFPRNAMLMLLVSTDAKPFATMMYPRSAKILSWFTHYFTVAGIEYWFFVGQQIPTGWKEHCFLRSPIHPIIWTHLVDKVTRQEVINNIKRSSALQAAFSRLDMKDAKHQE